MATKDTIRHPAEILPSPQISFSGGRPYPGVLNHRIMAERIGRRASQGESQKIPLLDSDTISDGPSFISALQDLDALRLFENWGPRCYPNRTYPIPDKVARGFAEYAGVRPEDRPAPIRHISPHRYAGPLGRALDIKGMAIAMDMAYRDGATVYLEMEAPVGSSASEEYRRTMHRMIDLGYRI